MPSTVSQALIHGETFSFFDTKCRPNSGCRPSDEPQKLRRETWQRGYPVWMSEALLPLHP